MNLSPVVHLLSLSDFSGGGYYEVVNNHSDAQLLEIYASRHNERTKSEPAFAELVRRHVDFVYSAAMRMVRDPHLAQDVTQAVFVALARNARQLAECAVLSGWLHRTARNIAAQTIRTEVRRRAREQEAAVMSELPETDATWDEIAPHLDQALGELNEADRDALLLRYFEGKSAQEMAGRLGISPEAAQKRVTRAVEHLRELFSRQKVTVGASGLAVLISASAVHSAPLGLASTISTAILTGTVLSTSTAITATTMTLLQKTLVTIVLATAAGAGIFEARQAAQLRDQNTSLARQLTQLQADSASLSNRLADVGDSRKLTDDQFNELLKLRGEAGMWQRQAGDAAQLRQENQQLRDRMTTMQNQTNQVSPEDLFQLQTLHTVNALKEIGLAMRIYAGDHNNQYATNFDQLKDILVTTNFAGNIGLDAFEFVNAGLVDSTMPDMIITREKTPRRLISENALERIYGLADGSVQTISNQRQSFADYEKQHSPPPSQ